MKLNKGRVLIVVLWLAGLLIMGAAVLFWEALPQMAAFANRNTGNGRMHCRRDRIRRNFSLPRLREAAADWHVDGTLQLSLLRKGSEGEELTLLAEGYNHKGSIANLTGFVIGPFRMGEKRLHRYSPEIRSL